MKLLMITDQLYLGGLETHIITLCTGLVRQGNKVFFYFNKGLSIWKHQLQKNGVVVLATLADAPLVDLVHLHVWGDTYQQAIKFAEERNIPLVATYHGLYRTGIGELSAKGKIICVSEKIRDFLGIDTAVIENGIDLEVFRSTPLPQNRTVAWVGRMDQNRWLGLEALFQACRSLHLECRLAGVHLNHHHIKILTKYPEVYWHGPVLDIPEFLKDIDIVFATSRGIREAMCLGRIAIIMNGVWYSGVVTPDNVESLRQDSFMGWGKKLVFPSVIQQDLERLYRNPERMQRLGEWGAQYAKAEFTAQTMVNQTRIIYTDLLKNLRVESS